MHLLTDGGIAACTHSLTSGGCTTPQREPVRRFCDGLLPRSRGIQSNPSQPEPPMNAAAFQHVGNPAGVRGECPFWHSPRRLSAVRPVKAFGFPRLRSAIASNRCRSSRKARPEPKAPSVIRFADATIPGRNHRLLPALAKNMPLACFLNASRLPEGGLFTPFGCTTASKGPMQRTSPTQREA